MRIALSVPFGDGGRMSRWKIAAFVVLYITLLVGIVAAKIAMK
jgi:hypothetical protein